MLVYPHDLSYILDNKWVSKKIYVMQQIYFEKLLDHYNGVLY